jgi:hypothetical protein
MVFISTDALAIFQSEDKIESQIAKVSVFNSCCTLLGFCGVKTYQGSQTHIHNSKPEDKNVGAGSHKFSCLILYGFCSAGVF